MSAFYGDQLHRSTLKVYSNLIDDFNPSLQKLVSLGNSYIQAFRAFASTSDAYFGALSKIGEKALHTVSSRPLGEVLMQISESQRRFTVELDGVLQWFSVDVIQQMDSNTRQDRNFIQDSRKFYEMEVHNKTTAMERQLWRGNSDQGEYLQFLKRSNKEALKEEERRHRFLAEKHCGLIQSLTYLMTKTGSSLQQKVDSWTKDVSATRELEAERRPSVSSSAGMREDIRSGREEQRGGREEQRGGREELPLGNVSSRAPSPQGSVSSATGERLRDGGRTMRARVSHQPAASDHTLLPFTKGEILTVLVPQPRKGWLYGQAESSAQQGWFPASFAEAVADPPPQASISRPTLRGNSSFSSLADQPQSRRQSEAQAAPPPPPPTPSEMGMGPPQPPTRAELTSENKRPKPAGSRPELFPSGTNPFATVKLRPTTTDDRSAPRFNR